MDYTEILKTGISGFAFLLAYFSYRLIRAEQNKNKPSQTILKKVQTYMYFSIILGFIVLTSTIIDKVVSRSSGDDCSNLIELINQLKTDNEFLSNDIESYKASLGNAIDTSLITRQAFNDVSIKIINVINDLIKVNKYIEFKNNDSNQTFFLSYHSINPLTALNDSNFKQRRIPGFSEDSQNGDREGKGVRIGVYGQSLIRNSDLLINSSIIRDIKNIFNNLERIILNNTKMNFNMIQQVQGGDVEIRKLHIHLLPVKLVTPQPKYTFLLQNQLGIVKKAFLNINEKLIIDTEKILTFELDEPIKLKDIPNHRLSVDIQTDKEHNGKNFIFLSLSATVGNESVILLPRVIDVFGEKSVELKNREWTLSYLK